MADLPRSPEELANVRLSRRQVLRGTLVAGGAAFLAACNATSSSSAPSAAPATAAPASAGPASAAPASSAPAKEDFTGVTVNVACNPTSFPLATGAVAGWKALTGGTAVPTLVPYAERALRFAADIVDKNSHFDLYFASKDFVAQFAEKLYAPIGDLGIDTADFVPITLKQLGANGKNYALPMFADQEFVIYNKAYWTEAGLDPTKLPTTWDGYYDLAPKLNALHGGKVEAGALPWLQTTAASTPYWLCYYNSFNKPFISDDKTQVLFDNDEAVQTWASIQKGFTTKFWGPSGNNSASDLDQAKIFNQGIAASEVGLTSFWGQARSGNVKDFNATLKPDDVGVAVMPGVTAGTTGSIIVTEGWGVGAFSKNQKAAVSFLNYVTGFDYQKKLATTGTGDSINAPSRLSVLADADVQKALPMAAIFATQGAGQLQWPGVPYPDMDKTFGLAFTNLFKGTWTPQQCKDETVKATKSLIQKWLTS
jgi:ABC-type glycerol-3-phosphate transport system substrate-binding protein